MEVPRMGCQGAIASAWAVSYPGRSPQKKKVPRGWIKIQGISVKGTGLTFPFSLDRGWHDGYFATKT